MVKNLRLLFWRNDWLGRLKPDEFDLGWKTLQQFYRRDRRMAVASDAGRETHRNTDTQVRNLYPAD